MEQMRRFRRQHEQLRAVIMRVLGPNLQALSAASGVAGDGDRSEVSDLVKLTRFFKDKIALSDNEKHFFYFVDLIRLINTTWYRLGVSNFRFETVA
jgi:hypothetical protein